MFQLSLGCISCHGYIILPPFHLYKALCLSLDECMRICFCKCLVCPNHTQSLFPFIDISYDASVDDTATSIILLT